MNSLNETLFTPLISLIPFSLIKWTGHGELIILYYHVVNDNEMPHIRNKHKYKGITQFTDDLEFLLKHYCPIGLKEAIHWVRGDNNLPPNRFLLTFDDGFREINDVIAPILLDKGIPATFFITSVFLDNRELGYHHKASLLVEKIQNGISFGAECKIKGILNEKGIRSTQLLEDILHVDYQRRDVLEKIAEVLKVDFQSYLDEKQPYLSSHQIMDLINKGFDIGAHSIDHPYFSELSLEEQFEQAIVSIKQIREKFHLDYGAFAFPHNDSGVSQEFFKRIHESGLIDITFGTGGMLSTVVKSHKQRVSLENPLLPARKILTWQYTRRLYKTLWSKMKGST